MVKYIDYMLGPFYYSIYSSGVIVEYPTQNYLEFLSTYNSSSKTSSYTLSEDIEVEVRIIFGFSLYAILLQVILVVYFKKVLKEL